LIDILAYFPVGPKAEFNKATFVLAMASSVARLPVDMPTNGTVSTGMYVVDGKDAPINKTRAWVRFVKSHGDVPILSEDIACDRVAPEGFTHYLMMASHYTEQYTEPYSAVTAQKRLIEALKIANGVNSIQTVNTPTGSVALPVVTLPADQQTHTYDYEPGRIQHSQVWPERPCCSDCMSDDSERAFQDMAANGETPYCHRCSKQIKIEWEVEEESENSVREVEAKPPPVELNASTILFNSRGFQDTVSYDTRVKVQKMSVQEITALSGILQPLGEFLSNSQQYVLKWCTAKIAEEAEPAEAEGAKAEAGQ
jgi:hypothetical protein